MFSNTRFRQHCDILFGPPLRKTACICIALGFSDFRLFASYMSFVLLMLTVQPDHLVLLEAQVELRGIAAAWPPLASDNPLLLDLCAGARAQYAANMFVTLFPDRCVTAHGLASWLLANCIFRYLETISFMDDVVFATPGAAEALVSFNIGLFLMQIKRNIKLRSTFAAYFNRGDGRRASFGVKVEVPRIARNSRLIDHLLEAIPLWASTVTRAADHLQAVFDAISDGNYSNAARAIEDLMSSLSSFGKAAAGHRSIRIEKQSVSLDLHFV